MNSILIVEQEEKKIQELVDALDTEYTLSVCRSHQEAISFLKHKIPNLVIIEEGNEELSVIRLMEYVKRKDELSELPIIVISDGEDQEFERRCLRMGVYDFIFRPCSEVGILSRVHRVADFQEKLKLAQQTSQLPMELVYAIQDQAKKDPLTHLLNRSCSEEMVNAFLSERRNRGALLMMDMDCFKNINDTYGHIIGDEILIEFANTLRALTRADDIVCRLGGDEFVVFLKDISGWQSVIEKVEQLVLTLEDRVLLPEKEGADQVKVSVSTGIAMAPQDGRSFKQLYTNADKALYMVKQNNKGSYGFYSEEGTGKSGHISRKRAQGDLDHLCSFIKEVGYQKGAYQVEYDGFKKIYRFLSRCIGRLQKDAQIVLFTLQYDDSYMPDVQELVFAMDNLKHAVNDSIRHGDVATNYSSRQFVIILMGSSTENGIMVAERICDKFNELRCYNPDIELEYDIQMVAPYAAEWK